MMVFAELTDFAATAARAQLRERVQELADAGVDGVSVSDHLFATTAGRPREEGVRPSCDPLTTLAAVAGITELLELQTVVMNAAWIHPALLLRRFNQQEMVHIGSFMIPERESQRVWCGMGKRIRTPGRSRRRAGGIDPQSSR